MKQKLTLLMAAAALSTASFAQTRSEASRVKPSLFGIHMNGLDYVTPLTFKDGSTNKTVYGPKRWDWGLGVNYFKGLTPNIDFTTKLSANFHDYAAEDRSDGAYTGNEVGIELEPALNLRPLADNHLINPYITAGIGGGYYSGEFAAYVPTGVGLQFNFKNTTYLFIQSAYRWSLGKDDLKSHLAYTLGLAANIGREKPLPPPPPPPVLDRDGDGVNDDVDRCPDTPGLAALQGCPDRDGDGIADMDDKCPDQAGIAKYQGCPIPDTDGDGINDEEDKCPQVKGVARYQGCPIPDTDGDGVNDEEDKCPSRPGPASNYGCPEIKKEVIEKINYAAKNVFFATGSYKLLAKSNKALNDVVTIMKADETLNLDIDGHTDSQGSDELNQTLSDNRAKAVKDYLVSKGISESRLKSTGYGESKPVADNATAAGRAKNRRTEMTARNY